MVPSVLWLAVVWAWGVLLAPTPTLAADEPLPFEVLVTYHSRTGHTEKMARAVVDGARSVPVARVVLKRVGEVTKEDLCISDVLMVGPPLSWSNLSADGHAFIHHRLRQFG